jgi:hypothetical protein
VTTGQSNFPTTTRRRKTNLTAKDSQQPDSIDLHSVLLAAWSKGFSVKSDFSRERAAEVAVASCLGLITTRLPDGTHAFGRTWRITPKGLTQLWKHTTKRKELKR